MEICSRCGATTVGENCHRCGNPLLLAEQLNTREDTDSTTPTVELISRGHDVVEVDAIEIEDVAIDEVTPPPVPPGAVEVTVDDVTVILGDETTVATGETQTEEPVDPPEAADRPAPGGDRWDHLRPHGEMPKLARRVSVTARLVETFAVLTAIAGIGTAAIHFYLNTRLEAAGRGTLVVTNISDLERIADIGLLVAAGLAAITVLGLLIWRLTGHSHGSGGRAGALAWIALISGVTVVTAFYFIRGESITEAIAANALIILGLGLAVSGFLVLARLVDRLDQAVVNEPY